MSNALPIVIAAGTLYVLGLWFSAVRSGKFLPERKLALQWGGPFFIIAAGLGVAGGLAALEVIAWTVPGLAALAPLMIGLVLYYYAVELNEEDHRFREQAVDILKRLGSTSILAIIAAVLPGVGGILILWQIKPLAEWLQSHGSLGLTVYVVLFMVSAGLALLPTYAQAILGGWTFKFAWGFPAAQAGFGGGALIGYFVARWFSSDKAIKVIEEQPKWKAVYDALLGGGFWKTLGLVTLLRLPPNSPFAMTNLIMAATKVPLWPYILGTLIGMAPRTAVAVWLATKMQSLDEQSKPAWMWIVSIVLALAVLAVLGHIGNKAIAKATGVNTDQQAVPESDDQAGAPSL
jgi:uncharacterized membrane protein YdjX (TVP38/TMEM64 family)